LRAWLGLTQCRFKSCLRHLYRARSYVNDVVLALRCFQAVFCDSSALVTLAGHSRRDAHGLSIQPKGESFSCQFYYLGKRYTVTVGAVSRDEADSYGTARQCLPRPDGSVLTKTLKGLTRSKDEEIEFRLQGVLRALRADYEAGRLQSFQELVHADLFSDFLEMAEYFLQEGYKDPAAVIAGGVLEQHLRKLRLDRRGQ
jgi:hypothetical protein